VTRPAYFKNGGGMIDANIHNRDSLESEFAGSGPAEIEECGSTTVVWPGDRFEIGALREIRIHCAAK
jgi:N-methylhydantoinase A/oxoprolinase/acetone carboxylase beta subunit